MNKFFTLKFNLNTYNPEEGKTSFSELSTNEKEEFKAPDFCVKNIMNFARSYNVVETEATGKVEMMLN